MNTLGIGPKSYRSRIRSGGLVAFHVAVRESDLWIRAERDLKKEALDLLLDCRRQVEDYISSHPDFAAALGPYPADPFAPPVVRRMIEETRTLQVGPMAAVAGAVAETVGRGLLSHTGQVIVENGGDIYLCVRRPVTVALYAGDSPFSDRIGIRVARELMPLGICSSSATVGHSLSLGGCDAACVLSASTAFADGAATALANRVRTPRDLETGQHWVSRFEPVLGGLIVLGNRMTAWGRIELVET